MLMQIINVQTGKTASDITKKKLSSQELNKRIDTIIHVYSVYMCFGSWTGWLDLALR